MNKTWNNSDLAKLSADLDEELTAIFDQVEAALSPEADPSDESQGGVGSEAAASVEANEAAFSLNDDFEGLDIDVTLENSPPFTDPAGDETDWLPPGLLGEPEMPVGLTPEVMRELSRIIEEAVEKGVAAALARLKINPNRV